MNDIHCAHPTNPTEQQETDDYFIFITKKVFWIVDDNKIYSNIRKCATRTELMFYKKFLYFNQQTYRFKNASLYTTCMQN